ncbi:serine/threonine-protein kinase [Nocardia sp. NPDC058640]|uniref:serine/threonine-protein kinase n=1 Tax=Nocardia sp. NPDC058640 TaxID=3346571 RepID=UPI00364FB7E1
MPPKIVAQRYELIELIGRGGMGKVFRGFDRQLKRRVAVKLIHAHLADDPAWGSRFTREAELMARMSHPGMPTVYDAGIDAEEQPYLVMEYIDGVTLDSVLATYGRLSVGAVACIGAQAAAVLAEAHGHSIFHRDLKPSNLMLCSDGTVRVLDFGIAIALDSAGPRLTRPGDGIGTPEYMAPEQVNVQEVVPQTDLYALGLVLFELLSGERAIGGASLVDTMMNQNGLIPPPLDQVRADVPEELSVLIATMLAKDHRHRPADATAVHTVLVRYIGALDDLLDCPNPGSPARMYATALGGSSGINEHSDSPPGGGSAPPAADFTRGDLYRALRHARDLADESRYVPAIGELRTALGVAFPRLGARDADVIDARMRLADLCAESGDHHQASSLYSDLIDDLTAERGPYDDQVMQCQQQLALAQVASGHVRSALTRLRRLHGQLATWHGDQDQRVVRLAAMIDHIRAANR